MVVTVPPIRQYYGYRPSEMVPTTFPGMWLYPSFEDLNVKISVLLCLQFLTDHGDQYMGMRMTNEVATKEYSRVYQRTNEDVHVSKIPSISAGVLCNQSFCQGPGFLNLSAPPWNLHFSRQLRTPRFLLPSCRVQTLVQAIAIVYPLYLISSQVL